MAKPVERTHAIELRKRGLSYREIRAEVPVSKGTLSLWLRQVGLAKPQRQRLTARRLAAARRGADKLRAERLARVAAIHENASREARGLIQAGDMMWAIGTILYWAEGAKTKPWRSHIKFQFTNTDLSMILLTRNWLERCCGVEEFDISYALHIHETADIDSARMHWLKRLNIPDNRLRTYFKRHNPSPRRSNVGRAYYGTMRMAVRKSTTLVHRIEAWIRTIVDHCGVV